ncbi:MAG: DUF6178 family protein [Desulfobacteraceae bacterium]
MQKQESKEGSKTRGEKPGLTEYERVMKALHPLTGGKILSRIMEHKNPAKLVRSLSSGDFFWLLKKVGEEDCLTLLELASEAQWEYLLDLEIWRKDRLDKARTSAWIKRLQQADPGRLVRWFLGQGEALASTHLFKSMEVIVVDKDDEAYNLPEGFFSLDGVFHIRVTDSEHRETIENILREMARTDNVRYQAFLTGLAGLLPAEMEEEMFRFRNVRLAEHGFLPSEEAISVYAPLDPSALRPEKSEGLPDILEDEETRAMVPALPLYHTETENILTRAVFEIEDPVLMDKIRLEFAGLCNQVMSADGLMVPELDVLVSTCQKVARVLNLALERLCGKDLSKAQQAMGTHSFVDLFRVGFGLTLKLKWEAERWLKESWFFGQGLDTDFWEEPWGGTLAGLLDKRPQHYRGLTGKEAYKDFEWLSELGKSLEDLRRLMVLDGLIERLAATYPTDDELMGSPELTFLPLLFNPWSRILLDFEPSFSGITVEQAKTLFRRLRTGSEKPPFEMEGFEEIFVKDLMSYASGADPEATSILKDTLSYIWHEFREEYEWVLLDDLDARYSKFISILPSPGVAPQ